jgi:AraC-like DNA-binding protein
MILRDVAPSPSLQEYVRKHQIIRFVFDADVILPIKAYSPRPEHCLVFYLRDLQNVAYFDSTFIAKHPKCTINGQHTLVTNRYIARDFWALQIVLQPGALYRLTGIPSYELTNTYIDAEAIWNPDISQIHDQMANCEDVDETIKIAELFLEKIINKSKIQSHSIDKVSKLILNQNNPQNIENLADQSCLSIRQFSRKFNERIGISPKTFDRITRFEKAFRMKNANPNLDWLSIAIACGYYDYQHLVKDYKDFTNLTPNAFYELDTKAPERGFGNKEV